MRSPVAQPAGTAAPASLQNIEVQTISSGDIEILLKFSAPVSSPKSFIIENPPQLVLDFTQVKNALKVNNGELGVGAVQNYAAVQAGDRLRIVFNLKKETNYSISARNNTIVVRLAVIPAGIAQVAKQHFESNAWVKTAHSIKGIDFRRDESGNGRVIVKLSDASMAISVEEKANNLVLDFINTSLPIELQRTLDVTDFGTPVDAVATKKTGSNVEMTIKNHGDYDHLAYQVNKQFIIDIAPKKQNANAQDDTKVVYTGEKLSLNFQDIPVRAVLQLLADFTSINIVASDTVKGNITLRLNNVPWDEALAIILRTQGLAQRKVGSVVMIAPAEEVAAREKEELESKKEVKELEPLITELIRLNYAKAAEMASLLKGQAIAMLSARGNVNTDARTNTIMIQDTPTSIATLRPLIEKLDVPVQQVLIESRIVEVDTSYEKNLGIQFGLTKPTHVSGTLTGANQINNNAITNDNAGTPTLNPLQDTTLADRLNVSFPAAPTSGTAASLGVALAKLGEGILLDLELSALESEGITEIIASPRLVTTDQHEAVIQQGQEIPYQQSTSSGATSVQFQDAVLALRVTPQITPDGNILMNLKINQDRADFQNSVLGTPTINTESIETLVLVENGQTIVLGGIYQEDKEKKVVRVPFLGSLPAIGHLFKNTQDIDNRKELLIFITPRIIQQTPIQ